jgi:hypothetical protein
MHNSNASTVKSATASLDLAEAMGYNAVLAPVSWEQLEPSPGQYDFTLLDHLVDEAARRDLYLGLLWFGTWKNGESSYPPLWVKGDTVTYFRALDAYGKQTTTISPFCEAAMKADAKAFSAMMAHLKKKDKDRRVLTVQVENECGVFLERDYSPAGDKAWTEGGWEGNPDPMAPQYFMAEAFAGYVDAVAAAGKEVYDIPVFANAWLAPADAPYGNYPNGGPREAVLEVWKRVATHLDWLSPDIYSNGFASLCAAYSDGQTLFIPETKCEAGRYYYAFGEAKAKGVFCFGYEEHYDNPYYVQECRVLSELMPLINKGLPMRGFFREENVDLPAGKVTLEIEEQPFEVSYNEGEQNAHGIIIRTGVDEYVIAGVGAWITFGPNRKIAFCEELRGGEVVQVLNGDETAHHNMLNLRGRLYLQDSVAPDGTVIPAPMYELSYQRRFRKDAQARFKVSGIYKVKLY